MKQNSSVNRTVREQRAVSNTKEEQIDRAHEGDPKSKKDQGTKEEGKCIKY